MYIIVVKRKYLNKEGKKMTIPSLQIRKLNKAQRKILHSERHKQLFLRAHLI